MTNVYTVLKGLMKKQAFLEVKKSTNILKNFLKPNALENCHVLWIPMHIDT